MTRPIHQFDQSIWLWPVKMSNWEKAWRILKGIFWRQWANPLSIRQFQFQFGQIRLVKLINWHVQIVHNDRTIGGPSADHRRTVGGPSTDHRRTTSNSHLDKSNCPIDPSKFDQIEIFLDFFCLIFFLNRFRTSWKSQKWRLEVPRMQRGRVSERNVEVRAPTCLVSFFPEMAVLGEHFEKLQFQKSTWK